MNDAAVDHSEGVGVVTPVAPVGDPAVPSRRQRASAVVRAHPVLCLLGAELWAAYAAYQVWVVVTGPIGVWNDTFAYVSVARSPLVSAGLLAGRRPPLLPLVWKATGSWSGFAVTQTVVSIAAWTLLAAVAALVVRPGWTRLVAWAAVLAFASCWPVTEWNWNVLTDSLAVSATAVISAAALLLVRRPTVPAALLLIGACLVAVADRDQVIWVVAPVGMVLGVWGAVRMVRRRSAGDRGTRILLVLGIGLVAVAGVAEVGAATAHRNVVNMEDVFVVRVFPFPARVQWFAAHGMPEADRIDTVAAATPVTPGKAEVVGLDLGSPEFRALDAWFTDRSQAAYTEYLVTHPGYVLSAPFDRPELTFNNADGNLAGYGGLVRPDPTNHALPLLPRLFFPAWPVVLGSGIAAAALVVVRRGRWRQLGVLAALVAAGLWSMLTAWHGDGEEIGRHTLEGMVQVRVAVLVLVLLAVLGPAERRVAARPEVSDRAGPVPGPAAAVVMDPPVDPSTDAGDRPGAQPSATRSRALHRSSTRP